MSFWTWANPGDQVLVWTVNVIFQVTLVMAVALAISVMFRRIAAIRYWLLGASLVLVMLSPAIALLMQRGGFGVMSVSLIQEIEPGPAPAPVDVQPEVIPPPPLVPEASFVGDMRSEIPPPTPLFGDEGIVPDATPPFDVVPSEPSVPIQEEALVAQEPVAASAAVPVAEASTTNRLGRVLRWTIPPILAIWIIGVVIHLIRLAVGWRRVLSILRSAQPNDDPALQEAFRRVGLDLSIRGMPELVLTDAITGPISAGLRRPRVILPTSLVHQIGPEQMHDILLHEVAHIVRRDQAVVLLQNFAAAMYWLHPLMRTLNRHLAQAREEVCDNYVLAATDAPSYSRTLLTLAQLVQSTSALPGTVGLFSSRWKLEHRVAGLLDERRNRTVRTSLKGKLIVAGIATVMLTLAAFGTMTLAVGPLDEAEEKVETEADAPPAEVESNEPAVAPPDDQAEGKTETITGVVLLPDGSPAAGATVRAGVWIYAHLQRHLGADDEPPITTVTADDNGHFTIEIDSSPFKSRTTSGPPSGKAFITASQKGFGPAWVTTDEIQPNAPSVELKLVDDVPIRGRVIDLEGKPVAGLSIKVAQAYATPKDDLTPWIESLRYGTPLYNNSRESMRVVLPHLAGMVEEVMTANDGSFEIRGIGRERRVHLEMHSEAVAFQKVHVVTRDMQPLKVLNSWFDNSTDIIYGANAVITATPARTIVGTVVDAATREPLPDVRIESYKFANQPISGQNQLVTMSDVDGNFRLIGMPKGEGNIVMFKPNDDQPYFVREIDVPDPDGLEPVSLTVELHRGIWITGRVTDKITGEPIPATRMYYLPYRDNKYVKNLPEFHDDGNVDGDEMRFQTDRDGQYRLVGMPGRAVIGGQNLLKSYRYGVGYDDIDGPKDDKRGYILTYRNPGNPSPKWPSAMREINPPADAGEVQLDFQFDPGASVQLELVDEKNQPVSGADVSGLSRLNLAPAEGPLQTAINFGPDETRTIVIHHKERNIGRVIEVGPDEIAQKKITVQLLPCATVAGILQKNGDPLPGLSIEMRVLPNVDFGQSLPSVSTDAAGRFVATLIPGCNYSLHAEGTSVDQVASIARELEIQPGETKDLGVLTLGDDRKFIRVEPSAAEQPDKTGNAEKKTSATGDNNIPLEDLGIGVRVVGPEGEPLNGVSIDVSFPEKVGLRAVTRVGDDGSFRIFGDRQFFERAAREFGRYQATITAAKDGLGSDVRLMMLADLPGSMLELQLQKLIDVHGRIVSAEGQPLPGVEIRIKDISRPATTMEEFIRSAQHDGSTSFEISDKRSFRPNEVFRTDADGRFSIPDVPAEHILSLEPRGSGVPFQLIFVASRSAPDSAAKRGTIGEKSFGNTVYYYAKFTHVAPPSRTIKGIVVDQKTGQPVDEINLHCFANGEQLKTGKDGRFEFTGCIKTDSYPFSVDTFTRPYFNRGMRIKDTPGLDPLEVRIELLQGTTLRGRVTGITGHVAGEVHYNVLYPSPYSDRMVDGSSRPGYSSAAVKADGTFDIQVLPGPGVVAFRAEHDIEGVNDFLSPWITVDDVKTTLKDGFGAVTKDYSVEGPIDFLQVATRAQGIGQVYLPQYHAATLISIGEDETDVAVELVVEKGTSLSGRVVDTDGQPVSKIQIAWLTEYSRDLQPIAGDQFTVRGISPKRPRSVMFFHEDLHQGAILLINGEEDASSPITVKLEPCGAVHGRFVDGKARPLADRLILVYPSSLYPYVYFGPTPWSTRTDKNGEYTIRNLVPGHEYSRYISLEKPNGFLTEKLSKETVKPGETVELGDKVIEILNVE